MIKFKGCPKCQGDLHLTQDIYGRYWNCLQCGFIGEPRSELAKAQRAAAVSRTVERLAV